MCSTIEMGCHREDETLCSELGRRSHAAPFNTRGAPSAKIGVMQVAPESSTEAGTELRPPLRRRIRHVLLGDGPIIPLAVAHGLSGSADAFVTVSLAGSLFFNISPDASRQQVLLYLLVTMAPLAVLAPLVGPAVDRFRRSQRFVASIFYLLRAVSCMAMVSFLLDSDILSTRPDLADREQGIGRRQTDTCAATRRRP